MQTIGIVDIVVITTVFLITWYEALKQVRRNQKLGRNTTNAKKELHLTMLFVAMYLLFLLTYLPLALADPNSPTFIIKVLLFNLMAMTNPIFTLILKKDFKYRFNASTTNKARSESLFRNKHRTYAVSNIPMPSN